MVGCKLYAARDGVQKPEQLLRVHGSGTGSCSCRWVCNHLNIRQCQVSFAFTHQALLLNEIPYTFTGPLPEHEIDENQISCKKDSKKWWSDPLGNGEATKALCLQPSKKLGKKNRTFQDALKLYSVLRVRNN